MQAQTTIRIGNSPKADLPFASFDSLLTEIGAGKLSGQITIAFETGTYNFTKALQVNTSRFTSTDHLTITSVARNRDSVTFSYSTSTALVGFILINNTYHVTFSHLNIHNSSTSNGHTVCINGPMEDVTFYRCNLKRTSGTNFATSGTMQTLSTNPLNSTSVKDNNNGGNGIDASVKWLRFIGNNIDNGCRNVLPMATTHRMQGLVFNDNTIFDNTAAGIMIYRADSVTCNRNHVMVKDATSSYWSPGIQLSAITGDSVCGNFVSFLNQTGNYYGGAAISISGVVNKKTGIGKSGRILIANNVVLGYNSSAYTSSSKGSSYLMSLSKVQADVYFNSVYNARASYAPTANNNDRTVYMMGINDTSDIHLVGNMLVAYDDKNQHVLHIATGTATAGRIVSESNNFYFMNGGSTYAYQNGNAVTSLTNLLTYLNDNSSISINPDFVDPTVDLQLKNHKPFTIVANPGIPEDFQGISRGKTTSIGAYTVASLDAALSDFGKTDFSASASGTNDLYITLMNAGLDTLYSATIVWDDGVQQKYNWKGKLGLGEKDSLKVGTFKSILGTTYRIKAWVTDPNGGKDGFKGNDTLHLEKYICKEILSGDYTVGANQDFATLNDALYVLEKCGVKAPVRLLLATGNYGALRISGNISGSSTTNTITLMPQANAKVTIDGGSAEASLTLNNASHWIFQGITIGNTANGLYGVMLEGGNTDILFTNCNILASTTATKTEMAVYFPNTSNSNYYPVNVRFIGNNIRGGVANFYMYYMAGKNASMPTASVTITDNTLSDAYQYGIYSYYYSHYTSISRNTITSRTGSSTYYGIYGYYYNIIDTLDANRFHIDATSAYGIYLSYYVNYSSYGGRPGTISNNEIMVSTSSTCYGIYFYYPYQTWNIYHNSILAESSGGAAYGMSLYNTSTSYKFNVRNNLIKAKAASAAYPVYISNATYAGPNYAVFNYNNYFGADLNDSATYVGYAGSAKATLADWQAVTQRDTNSYNSNPAFTNTSISLELNDYSAYLCPRLAGAAYDIFGTARGPVISVGCYSLEMSEDLDLSARKVISPTESAEVKCFGDFAEVAISIQNKSRLNADFSQSPLTVTIISTGAANFRKDTVINYGKLASALTDTIRLGRIPTVASGIYKLQIMLSDTADHHPENDTLWLDYNVSHVDLPYDVHFTTTPTEFININRAGNSGWVVSPKDSDAIAPVFGSGYLKFKGAGFPGCVSDAVFNSVNVYQTSNPKLSFWYAHTDEAVRDFVSIQVTTDEGLTYKELSRIAASDTGVYWKQYDVDLSEFVNANCISIVFKAYSMGGTDQYIDRVRITADKDRTIHLILPETDQLSACHLQNLPLKVVMENVTRSNMNISNDTITVQVSGANNQQFTYVYNKLLEGFEKDTIDLSNSLDLSANGNYRFEACLQAIDDYPANDTLRDSSLYVRQDVALSNITGIDNQSVFYSGEKLQITATVTNTGNIPVDEVLLRMTIDGEEALVDTLRRHLEAGDSIIHAMSSTFTVPAVDKDQPYFFFELKAELACDADNSNDSIGIVGNVEVKDSIDIQVLDITATTPALGKTKINPIVRVANIGNLNASNVVLHLNVTDASQTVLESISETINALKANETKDYTFTMNYKVPNYTGQYTLKAYVEAYEGDEVRGNDTLAKQFNSTKDSTGIRDAESLNWNMEQNVPNPAAYVTRIPYTLPQEGIVTFRVMGAEGKLIYRHSFQSEAGQQALELNTSDWADGIYYYSMEYQGQRIVRKMTISR